VMSKIVILILLLRFWGDDELSIIRLGIIEKLGYRKNVPVNLHIFSRNKVDLNLFTNIANGIVLDGLLEVRT